MVPGAWWQHQKATRGVLQASMGPEQSIAVWEVWTGVCSSATLVVLSSGATLFALMLSDFRIVRHL